MSRSPVAVLVVSLTDPGIGRMRLHPIHVLARLGIPADPGKRRKVEPIALQCLVAMGLA